MKELYVSRLTATTTNEVIENYMLQRGLDVNNVKIPQLVPNNLDTSTLSYE